MQSLAGLISTVGGQRELKAICSPFTGELLGTVPVCTEEDTRAALKQARTAQKYWARRTFAERKAIFARFHDLALAHQEEFMDVLQMEAGKARQHALEEVFDVAINARYYAYHTQDIIGTRRRRGAIPLITTTWEIHHPVGVVGVVAPWNYPLTLAISDTIPAMMAGNSIVLKPAEETPFTALYAMQLMREAGLPHEVFQIVTGKGRIVGQELVEGANFLMFTGSTATGRRLAGRAGERLIGYSMELGGKNPVIVLNDANMPAAVDGVIRGAFSNAGQLCVSFERLYVQSGIFDRFMKEFIPKVKALRLGTALDFSTDMGTLISQDQLDKIRGHVEDAVAKGATILAGGRPRPDLGPFFYEPTVLTNVTPDMQLYANETYGPVISVYKFDKIEDAIRMANDSEYGLNASVWTRNIRLGKRIAERVETGTVNINEAYQAAWGSVDSPMGGVKASGVGRRHGREGILKYTESQTISVQRVIPLAPFGPFKVRYFAIAITLVLLLMKRIPGLR
jgi:succinate-semialdehyde dehydrogenase/glutarate-semialdehyde dehydrogenase